MSAGGKKAEAAIREIDGGLITFTWRGAEFTRPARLPITVAFQLAELEDSDDIAQIIRFIGLVVGDAELAKLKAKLAEDGDALTDLGEVAGEFIGAAFEATGDDPGE
jgi:hypothetical protein